MLTSVRSRMLVASALWTAGLLLLMHLASMLLIHTLPALQGRHPLGPTLVGVLLMTAGGAVAFWSLAPLRRLAREVSRVSTGETTRIDGTYPSEVQPAVNSLNQLIDNRERSIARAYAAAGDLAHGLKTPLALLTRDAEVARDAGHLALAESITDHVRRMSGLVDRHLARARAAAVSPSAADTCLLAPCVSALIRTVATIYAIRELQFDAAVPPLLRVRARQEDVEEMLGNLLDNACKAAASTVSVAVTDAGAAVTIAVDDDGPGLAAEARVRALERGVRLDEASAGSGLGLSIVRDLAEHYGGSLVLDASPRGGLSARLTLPA